MEKLIYPSGKIGLIMIIKYDKILQIDLQGIFWEIVIVMINLVIKFLPYFVLFLSSIEPAYAGLETLNVPYLGKCLDNSSSSMANKARVKQYDCTGTKYQSFEYQVWSANWSSTGAKHDVDNLECLVANK